MKDEQLDIVDENNKPTGEVRFRSEVHSKGFWHRTVHVYLFRRLDDKYEFLVHLRAKTKDLNPNKWDTRFGGHLKSGEKIKEAVLGEIKDEVGLDVKLTDLIEGPVIKRNKYPNNEFSKIYFYQFNDDINILNFKDNEVQKVKWMAEDEIIKELENQQNKWTTRPNSFKEVVNHLKSNIK